MNQTTPSPRPSPPPGERVSDLSAVALAKAEGRVKGEIHRFKIHCRWTGPLLSAALLIR